MENLKRYQFVDWNGNPKGLEHVDSLEEAVQIAYDYQCEIIDTKATQSPIVYSVWDGTGIMIFMKRYWKEERGKLYETENIQ